MTISAVSAMVDYSIFLTKEYQIYNDATIELQSGAFYPVNRTILVHRSPFFHNLFIIENAKNIKLDLVPDDVVIAVVRRLYGTPYDYTPYQDANSLLEFKFGIVVCRDALQLDIMDEIKDASGTNLIETINMLYQQGLLDNKKYLSLLRGYLVNFDEATLVQLYPTMESAALKILIREDPIKVRIFCEDIYFYDSEGNMIGRISTRAANRHSVQIIAKNTVLFRSPLKPNKLSVMNPYGAKTFFTLDIPFNQNSKFSGSENYVVHFLNLAVVAYPIYSENKNHPDSSIKLDLSNALITENLVRLEPISLICNRNDTCLFHVAGREYIWEISSNHFYRNPIDLHITISEKSRLFYADQAVELVKPSTSFRFGPNPLFATINELYYVGNNRLKIAIGFSTKHVFLFVFGKGAWYLYDRPFEKFTMRIAKNKTNVQLIATSLVNSVYIDFENFEMK